MESRIPRLTFHLKKAASCMDVSVELGEEKTEKAPANSAMARAKTVSVISRAAKTAPKRPAAVTNPVEAKKPKIRPATTAVATAVSKSPVRNATATAKPNKWDVKGRLAYAMEEPASFKQKHRNTTQAELETLRAKMESRLPRPKIYLKKAASCMDVSVELGGEKKEKAPANSAMARAKTMSVISPAAKTAPKRPAAVTNPVEAKKPNIRPATTAVATAVSKSPVRNATATAKPNKWDVKGRLAYAMEELASFKQKHRNAEEAKNTTQAELETLRQRVASNKLKAERFEDLNMKLSESVNDMSAELIELRQKKEQCEKELLVLREKLKTITASLVAGRVKCREHKAVLQVEIDKVEKLQFQVIASWVVCREICREKKAVLQAEIDKFKKLQSQVDSQRTRIDELNKLKEDLENMSHALDKERRPLHNTLQEMQGNIRVFCRVRPKIPKDNNKVSCIMSFPDECSMEVGRSEQTTNNCGARPRTNRQEFSFDKVFPPSATQAEVFEELSLLVQSALEGFNVCVFAYGQTGSGKTYTMEGNAGTDSEGMIPRTVKHIFQEKKQFELHGWNYTIEASFLEIYNEHIVDLLDSQPKTHEIRMRGSKGTDIYVTNLNTQEVETPKEFEECLRIAQRNRAVAATQSNEHSSRSHSVARIKLTGTHMVKGEMCVGTLNLVDLAGSERLKNEEVARTTETKNINKSLANLGNVILALLKKQSHVPYRDSKLTHLLMPCLGGNSKTLMLLNISPLDECYYESLNSLRFASSVNSCKTENIKRT